VTGAQYRAMAPETTWEVTLHGLCDRLGVIYVHHPDSIGATPGWPDDVLIGTSVIYLEIKTATGRVSPAQKAMHRALAYAGHPVHVVRPDDFRPGGLVEQLVRSIALPPGAAREPLATIKAETVKRRQRSRTRRGRPPMPRGAT
jgi:hypothetical protein